MPTRFDCAAMTAKRVRTEIPSSVIAVTSRRNLKDNRLRNDLWRLAAEGRVPHPAFGGAPRSWTTGELAEAFGLSVRAIQVGISESKERAGILANAS